MSLLLPLLFLWGLTAPVESNLNPQKLQYIWTYISNTYPKMMNKADAMYAVAFSIPNVDCNGDIDLQKILTGNDNNKKDKLEKDIKNKLGSEDRMYVGDRLMIARPNTEHAEHRLLTQLKNLNWPVDSCVVFFVKDSPCTEKCLNNENKYKILKLLETFETWDKDKKAFLFQNIYYRDLGNPEQQQQIKEYRDQGFSETVIKQMLGVSDIPPPPQMRSQMLSAFDGIEKYVPLYRCNGFTDKGCIHCVDDKITLNNNECLREMEKETESDASFHQSSSSQAGSKRSHGQSSRNNPNETIRKILKKGV
ncbi:uncharacterized protein LOC127663087 isoform X1 [Xyrauchen texanus]|uniref:uncharacterized protein LOC127663087 isoform X1 n=1 Tax=Xyrauchen texanus TaxID=154827 RepID=UPI002241DA91|nr:uncharacterized protein LOC127663087 isoform X1 [Xyrauchen texanus]XP_052010472.1 uncharacterized protein LOC127663087 isoform X1 [Xyrauchen texanus]XP_052010473.1 uncharacterized protein LOC127663087 isoform X1 [Xyrauchen texanus]